MCGPWARSESLVAARLSIENPSDPAIPSDAPAAGFRHVVIVIHITMLATYVLYVHMNIHMGVGI